MSLYDLLSSTREGRRRLASARLRYDVIGSLHAALAASGKSQSELAESLGIRRSAVNAVFRGNGNLRVNTIADYLQELGMEGRFVAVPAGSAREAAEVWRKVQVTMGANPASEAALEAAPKEWADSGHSSGMHIAAAASSKRTDFAMAA